MIILASKEQVSVVARDVDMMRGHRSYYAFYQNGYYDPKNNFKPCFDREGEMPRRRLFEKYVECYRELLDEADKNFDNLSKFYKKQAEKQVEQPKSGGLGEQLEEIMVKVLAEQSVDKVLDRSKPMLDQYIRDTYGMLPQVHEVKTPQATKKIKGVVHEKFDTVLNLVSNDIPVFLTGGAGTGKNVICKQVAEALDLEFYFTNAVTQEYKLTGFIDANGKYHETQFYKAFTEGGLFMLDEMDASIPEVLIILNAAIANRYFDFPTGRVEANENFRLIAAGNTFGTGADMEYTGRYQLDAASLDRFALVEITYSRNIEEALADGDTDLVEFVEGFRKAVEHAGMKHLATYRCIERIKKLDGTLELKEVMKICLLKSMDKEDVHIIKKTMAENDLLQHNRYLLAMAA